MSKVCYLCSKPAVAYCDFVSFYATEHCSRAMCAEHNTKHRIEDRCLEHKGKEHRE